MFGSGGEEPFLQHRVAGAQQRQLAALLEQARQRFKHQIEPFLAGETADDGKQRRFIIDLQAHGDLQLTLVFRLLLQRVAIVAHRQQEVVLRAPDTVVNAVENSRQPPFMMALTQQPSMP